MADKKFFSHGYAFGFTLIETLLSIALLSAVAIGLFSFFTNAMTYTSDNEKRTVAINIARGVAAYFEKNVHFSQLYDYMENNDLPFFKMEKSSCNNETLQQLLFPNENLSGGISSQQMCTTELAPTVNNVNYETSVYFISWGQKDWDQFLSSSDFVALPEQLKARIREERNKITTSGSRSYMIKLYATVRWGERARDISWVEGVVTDETIR
ncbi:type II secretion system protein [Geobacillus thermoleovorans]|uniref:type II secretion system protein n=1 Tax=Geobacillus thermoleovorans TaxID=33941 RepID=UPI00345BA827